VKGQYRCSSTLAKNSRAMASKVNTCCIQACDVTGKMALPSRAAKHIKVEIMKRIAGTPREKSLPCYISGIRLRSSLAEYAVIIIANERPCCPTRKIIPRELCAMAGNDGIKRVIFCNFLNIPMGCIMGCKMRRGNTICRTSCAQ